MLLLEVGKQSKGWWNDGDKGTLSCSILLNSNGGLMKSLRHSDLIFVKLNLTPACNVNLRSVVHLELPVVL